ncbi:response regulator [Aquicoccus sp. G2-2]|uniref:response regulator n=1 Tax=Aquicoccus sp. G2-2 TaxID=3092120 RepID=UPI002AE0ACC6|nr:response regulator [Aquicoccus sp. G2-2]MEA1115280.1 response regulator [Aquicoccus sp. G2-2]
MSQSIRGSKVLVVEDEVLIFMMLEDMLSDLGATVAGHATGVAEGVSLVERGGFDVAILDLNLNGTKVFPVAEALQTRGLPFLFTSGYGSAALDGRFADQTCIDKPYQVADISRALSKALSEKVDSPES